MITLYNKITILYAFVYLKCDICVDYCVNVVECWNMYFYTEAVLSGRVGPEMVLNGIYSVEIKLK